MIGMGLYYGEVWDYNTRYSQDMGLIWAYSQGIWAIIRVNMEGMGSITEIGGCVKGWGYSYTKNRKNHSCGHVSYN